MADDLSRQRLKMLWFAWGYGWLLTAGALSFGTRLHLLRRFLRIDWSVLHAHTPKEVSILCRELVAGPVHPGAIVVEAGCWQGGSATKMSLLCRILGYRLHIYDSFAGVAPMKPREGEHDFSGEYAAPMSLLRGNLGRHGDLSVCELHPGWFSQTLVVTPPAHPVRMAYIDCDVADGTYDALVGIVPRLVANGCVFSQDCHIPSVTEMLADPATWSRLGVRSPRAVRHSNYLVALHDLGPRETYL